MATLLPTQSGSFRYDNFQFLETKRPWLSLYGIRVRPVAPVGSTSSKPVYESSLLHRSLPDELLQEVFMRLSPYWLGRAACVCRKWRYSTRMPSLWRNACLKTWQVTGRQENERLCAEKYGSSWRAMWHDRPRLRFDGLYVSRNTYIRTGIAEWRITNPVHLVCYYRYLRFFPNGNFLYKTTPLRVKEVAKSMQGRPTKSDGLFSGRCTQEGTQVEGAVIYPGLRPTVLRISLRLRGTIAGAYNRLDLLSLVTSGVDENDMSNGAEDVEGLQEHETHDADIPVVSHRRGMQPFVFIPFEEAENLPSKVVCPVDLHTSWRSGLSKNGSGRGLMLLNAHRTISRSSCRMVNVSRVSICGVNPRVIVVSVPALLSKFLVAVALCVFQ